MHKKFLKFSFKALVLAAAMAVLPMGGNAAGLGRITVLSALGQPLRAEIELSASREELSSMSAHLASHEAFRQSGIEFVPALAGVKLVLDKRSGSRPVIRLTTDRPINEPFLNLLIELDWAAGRLVREYTFLLDPAPEVLARKPVAAPVGKRDASAAAQPSPVAAPKQPEVRAEDKPRIEKTEEAKPAGEGREVKKGEYLRKIAAESQYDGVSLDQMLVAIFRSNKDAFIGNNIHRLKAGKILNIPDRDTAAAVETKDAHKTISAHTADFNAYRQKLAAAAAGAEAPQEEAAKQVATGKIGAKVEEKAAAPAETKDQLRVSKAEAKDARLAQGKIAALEEDLVAKEKALKEAQSRQTELEKNVKELQKLVELKNQNLAELQKQAAAKAASAPAPAAAPEVKKSELPVAAAPAKAPEAPPAAAPTPAATEKPAEKPAEPAKAPEAPPAAAPSPAADEKPVEKPAEPIAAAKPAEQPKPAPKKAPPPPPPPPEPDFLDEMLGNPAILGGGVLVLGLLGFVAYRQRQKKKLQEVGEAPTTTSANLTANSVFGATGGQSVDTTGSSMATDFSQASISAIDADEGVDPVAEADVYMAYGRDAQAEEILLDALKTDPTRTAIHVKLLEIYAGRKNNKQFETLASDLYAQTGGVGGDWEKAAAMGLKLDPANPLYGGGAASEKQTIQTDSTVVVPTGEKQLRDTWTMPGELSQISEAVEKGGTGTVILERPVESAAEEAAGSPALDFDLDLGTPAAPAPQAPAAPAPAQAEAPAGLDFDLGLDFKPAESKRPESEPAYNPEATMILEAGKAAQAPAADLALDIKLDEPADAGAGEGLHFDLDLGAPAAAAATEEVVDLEKTIAGGSTIDFDFNLGAPAEPRPAPAAEPAVDLGAINLDLGMPAAAAEAAMGDEVATKLELAKAYEEMGDKEGARELLTEVTREGNAEQQAKAQAMLAKLS